MASEQPPAPLPSGAAASSGSSGGSSSKIPSKAGTMLARTPPALDAFIAHLHRCMQTPAGIDTVLLFVAYASRLTASALDAATRTALRGRLAALLLAIPARGGSTTVVVKTPAAAVKVLATSARLRALAALLSEARMVMRLWGLLGLYLSLRKLVAHTWAGKGKENDPEKARQQRLDGLMAWARLTLGIAFQVLENAGLLAHKGVLNLRPATAGWCMRWATRAWSAGTFVEIMRLLVEHSRKQAGDVSSAEYRKWKEGWTGDFVRNAAWAPITVHLSVDKGFVSEPVIGGLATLAGWIQMSRLWRETA